MAVKYEGLDAILDITVKGELPGDIRAEISIKGQDKPVCLDSYIVRNLPAIIDRIREHRGLGESPATKDAAEEGGAG